mmetsp:Transcript_11717/g.23846  ORF Transcript_11717/g.23846 Transcript_11717/m.23846 type:complete len:479 (-) Transcript_11717:74-1510(-)
MAKEGAYHGEDEVKLPSGAILLEEFVSPEEERFLIQWLDQQPWAQLAKRRVQHYGYEFKYGLRGVDRDKCLGPLPALFHEMGLMERLVEICGTEPDQLTINEYLPGVGLRPHVDTHSMFEDSILSLSLLSGVSFEFRRGVEDGLEQVPGGLSELVCATWLSPRSLLLMSGESRYGWRHYIPLRKYDRLRPDETIKRSRRVSLTFRRVRQSQICSCAYPQLCDSQQVPVPPPCEQEYVHETYEAIAPHFSSTRFAVWPGVREFLRSLQEFSIVADVGCGNGKYLNAEASGSPQRSLFMIGSDRSETLVRLAANSGSDILVGDCLHIAMRNECVDAAIMIAVLHHIHTDQRRRSALREFLRILKPGGRGLIYVWAYEQDCPAKTVEKWTPLDGGEKGDYLVPWQVPRGKEQDEAREDWFARAVRLGGRATDSSAALLYRYYHVFREGELVDLCTRVEGLEVVRHWFDRSNWAVEISKSLQ